MDNEQPACTVILICWDTWELESSGIRTDSLLRVGWVEGTTQLDGQGFRPREVNVLVLSGNVTTNCEPAGEASMTDGTRDPDTLVETTDVSPEVVLVPVGAGTVRAFHQLH